MSDWFFSLRMFSMEYDKNTVDRISTIIESGIAESDDPSLIRIEICEDSESSSITSIVRMKSSSTPSGQENSLESPA